MQFMESVNLEYLSPVEEWSACKAIPHARVICARWCRCVRAYANKKRKKPFMTAYQFKSKPSTRGICVAAVTAALSGCSATGLLDPLLSTGRVTASGVNQQFDEASYEKIHLPSLLDPENLRTAILKTAKAAAGTTTATPSVATTEKEDQELNTAFVAFYDATYNKYGSATARRDQVQARILGASEQRCNVYKTYLRRVETYQSTVSGILTTILGGAGAIATGGVNSRAFAGLAGVSSGVGAELKQGFFANLTSHVIIPGIDAKREGVYKGIQARRRESVQSYNVQEAIMDASRYHGACTLATGLEHAADAIKELKNPGLSSISVTLQQMTVMRKLMDGLRDPSIKLTNEDRQLLSGLTVTGGVVTGFGITAFGEELPLALLSQSTYRLGSEFGALVGTMQSKVTDLEGKAKQEPDATKKKLLTDEVNTLTALLKPEVQDNDKKKTVSGVTVPGVRDRAVNALMGKVEEFTKAEAQFYRLRYERDKSTSASERDKNEANLDVATATFRRDSLVPMHALIEGIVGVIAKLKGTESKDIPTELGKIDALVRDSSNKPDVPK